MNTHLIVDQVHYYEIGPRLGRVLTKLTKEMERMANNFERMTKAVERIANEVEDVAAKIRNPAVDNNNQSTIDDLAGRLEAAADSLHSAGEAEAAEDAGPMIGEETSNPLPESPAPTETGGEETPVAGGAEEAFDETASANTENPVEGQ